MECQGCITDGDEPHTCVYDDDSENDETEADADEYFYNAMNKDD